MSSITVQNLSVETTEKQVTDFFSFCGKVKSVSLSKDSGEKTQTAIVVFEKPAAIRTALLLSESELAGNKVVVTAGKDYDEHTIREESPGAEHTSDQDIDQEYKPKSAIFAEYLSHGYLLGDKVVEQGLKVDQKHGISSRFTKFLHDFDSKYHVQSRAEATDRAYNISDNYKKQSDNLQKYLDNALDSPTGHKIRSFYSDLVKNAGDVHAEARRLADLKKGQSSGSTAATTSESYIPSPSGPTRYEEIPSNEFTAEKNKVL